MTYIRKPEEVKVFKWEGKLHQEKPEWVLEAIKNGKVLTYHTGFEREEMKFFVDKRFIDVKVDDYLVMDTRDEVFYYSKDDFEDRFELKEE